MTCRSFHWKEFNWKEFHKISEDRTKRDHKSLETLKLHNNR